MVAKAFIALLVVSMVVPMVGAKTWTAPYVDGEAGVSGSGCRLTWAYHERTVGKNHVYASVCGIGSSEAVSRVGSRVSLYSGELLGSFSDSVTTETYQKGHLQCLAYNLIGDLKSSYEVKVQKWKLVGNQWNLEQEKVISTAECSAAGTITSIDRTVSGSGFFTFNPGTTYRLTVQSTARASGIGPGSASADFYSGGWPDDGRTTVHHITLANQAPKAQSRDVRTLTVLDAVRGYSEAKGIGCDIDHGATKVSVSVDGKSGYAESSGGATGCREPTYRPAPFTPGTYTIRTKVTDAGGATATDTGTYRSEILPALLNTYNNFPDLSQIAEGDLGADVAIELLVNQLGEIRAYRVASDGQVFLNTMNTVTPAATDSFTLVEYNRVLAIADIKKDGVSQWSGLVAEATIDSPWWNIIPVGQTDPSTTADPVVQPDVSFPALDQVPYRELVPETEHYADEGQ